jgi:hypothetical protein
MAVEEYNITSFMGGGTHKGKYKSCFFCKFNTLALNPIMHIHHPFLLAFPSGARTAAVVVVAAAPAAACLTRTGT